MEFTIDFTTEHVQSTGGIALALITIFESPGYIYTNLENNYFFSCYRIFHLRELRILFSSSTIRIFLIYLKSQLLNLTFNLYCMAKTVKVKFKFFDRYSYIQGYSKC